jgi:hypothetical protein
MKSEADYQAEQSPSPNWWMIGVLLFGVGLAALSYGGGWWLAHKVFNP